MASKEQDRLVEKLKDYARNVLSARAVSKDRMRRKLADRLARLGGGDMDAEWAGEVVESVLALCESYHMIDDAALADTGASAAVRRGRSLMRAGLDLEHKGIGRETSAAALDGYDELAAATAYAKRKKVGPFARKRDRDADFKAKAAFMRNGFPSSMWDVLMALDLAEL